MALLCLYNSNLNFNSTLTCMSVQIERNYSMHGFAPTPIKQIINHVPGETFPCATAKLSIQWCSYYFDLMGSKPNMPGVASGITSNRFLSFFLATVANDIVFSNFLVFEPTASIRTFMNSQE